MDYDADTKAALYDYIVDILADIQVPDDAHNRVLQAYCEPWRTYHNHHHIVSMLRRLERLEHELDADALERLRLMILYHDVWYKVGHTIGLNEQKSGEWAYMDLSKGITAPAIYRRKTVQTGILATVYHTLQHVESEAHPEVGLLLDLDLWGLGSDPAAFAENTERVWREFQPVATREQFDEGRKDWAAEFLKSREHIYHTRHARSREKMAQFNLRKLAEA